MADVIGRKAIVPARLEFHTLVLGTQLVLRVYTAHVIDIIANSF